jgi:hypothetical protein
MGQAIPRQQPAVALRPHSNRLRALLAVALIAAAGLTVAVVILANDSDEGAGTSSTPPIGSINYGNSKYVNPSTGYPTVPFQQLEQAQAGVTPETEMKNEAGTAAAIGQANVTPETEVKNEARTAAAIGHPGAASEPSDSKGSEYGTSQYRLAPNDSGSELSGSKTDPQGPASLLP